MAYQLIAALLVLLALFAALLALKLLFNRDWLAGFLRGLAGLLAAATAALLVAACLDVATYRTVAQQEVVATLSFHQKEASLFEVELQPVRGEPVKAVLSGAQWQLDVRLLKWSPLLKAVGFGTGYRFSRLAGKHLEFDPRLAHDADVTALDLSESRYLDVWSLLNRHAGLLPWLETYNGGVNFVPMVDGAIFEVLLSGSAMTVRPLNDVAKKALESW